MITDVMKSLHEDGDVIKGAKMGVIFLRKVVRRKFARIFDRMDWLMAG